MAEGGTREGEQGIVQTYKVQSTPPPNTARLSGLTKNGGIGKRRYWKTAVKGVIIYMTKKKHIGGGGQRRGGIGGGGDGSSIISHPCYYFPLPIQV